INTIIGGVSKASDTVSVTTTFTTAQYEAFLAKAPFNPFVISNIENKFNNPTGRGREIHLVNNKPTALANVNLLGTEADSSNPAAGRYYVTSDNRPFGLNFTDEFEYPIEEAAITSAYNHFVAWALSGGVSYKDWYQAKPGYRNNQNIYSK